MDNNFNNFNYKTFIVLKKTISAFLVPNPQSKLLCGRLACLNSFVKEIGIWDGFESSQISIFCRSTSRNYECGQIFNRAVFQTIEKCSAHLAGDPIQSKHHIHIVALCLQKRQTA